MENNTMEVIETMNNTGANALAEMDVVETGMSSGTSGVVKFIVGVAVGVGIPLAIKGIKCLWNRGKAKKASATVNEADDNYEEVEE